MKRDRRICVLACLFLIFTLSCGGSSATSDASSTIDVGTGMDALSSDLVGDTSTGGEDQLTSDVVALKSQGLLRPDCGPADGPAARLFLLLGEASQCSATTYTGGHIVLYFDLPITAPMTVMLDKIWSVELCQSTGLPVPCETATAGSITFTSFEKGVGAKGSYTFTFSSGEKSGSFDAIWCAPAQPLVCG